MFMYSYFQNTEPYFYKILFQTVHFIHFFNPKIIANRIPINCHYHSLLPDHSIHYYLNANFEGNPSNYIN